MTLLPQWSSPQRLVARKCGRIFLSIPTFTFGYEYDEIKLVICKCPAKETNIMHFFYVINLLRWKPCIQLFQFLQYFAVMQSNQDHGWLLMLLVILLLLGMLCGGFIYRRFRPTKLPVKDVSENPCYPSDTSKCSVLKMLYQCWCNMNIRQRLES